MENNEAVYDELISPRMAEIIAVCKEHDIPMFATFQYSKTNFCTTHIPVPDEHHMLLDVLNAMSRCVEDNSVNIDKFLFWMKKNYANGSSIFMSMLGSKAIGHDKEAVKKWNDEHPAEDNG